MGMRDFLDPPESPVAKTRCADCSVPYVCGFEPRVGWCPVIGEFIDRESDWADEHECFEEG